MRFKLWMNHLIVSENLFFSWYLENNNNNNNNGSVQAKSTLAESHKIPSRGEADERDL